MRSAGSSASDSGNATVGFIGTVGLFLLLVYTIMSLALTWYVREILIDSAMEGARAGSLDGAGTPVAIQRTTDLITSTLPDPYAANVSARATAGALVVTVTSPAPLVGFLGNDLIEVQAHVPVE